MRRKRGLEWRQVRAVKRRHLWRLSLVPMLVCLALAPGWLFAMGPVIGWVERLTGVDVWERAESLPRPVSLALMPLMSCFVPFVVAPAVSLGMVARAARRVTAHYRDTPACPFCGYDLTGVDADGHGLRECPECGQRSVRFDARFDWWHTLAPVNRS